MYYVVGALRRCGVRGGGVRKTFTLAAASGSGSLVSVSVGCRALSTEVQVSIWQVFSPGASFFLSFLPRTLKLGCGESTTALKLPAGDKADSAAKPRSPRMTHGASLQNVSTHRTDLYPHRSMRTLGR